MKSCPCKFSGVTPCKKQCSCANSGCSGGCLRCHSYGLIDKVNKKLVDALNILDELVKIQSCVYAMARKNNQSCKEYETNIQGVPMNGCYVCRAKELLDE